MIKWRAREDSNLRPPAPQADALSTELRARELRIIPDADLVAHNRVTMISVALALVLHIQTLEDILFKRTYMANAESFYSVSMVLPGNIGEMKAKVTTKVKSVQENDATIHYLTLSADIPGMPSTDNLSELDSKVGTVGIPSKGSIKTSDMIYVFLGMAGMTSNTKTKVGDTVTTHWQSDSKDCVIDGSGKIGKFDPGAKTLTVDWKIDMKPNYTDASVIMLQSTYSTIDFSLTKSEGTAKLSGTAMKMVFTRLAKA